LLCPQLVPNVPQKIAERKQAMQRRYGGHPLKPLAINDKVWVQPTERGHLWKPAIVTEVLDNRSFLVHLSNGSILRRNRRFLRLRKGDVEPEAATPESPPDSEDDELHVEEGDMDGSDPVNPAENSGHEHVLTSPSAGPQTAAVVPPQPPESPRRPIRMRRPPVWSKDYIGT
jgi:hypothetical protein